MRSQSSHLGTNKTPLLYNVALSCGLQGRQHYYARVYRGEARCHQGIICDREYHCRIGNRLVSKMYDVLFVILPDGEQVCEVLVLTVYV